jgi:dipeptidyl aminopeptidase/acylaminoacyl peptidase
MLGLVCTSCASPVVVGPAEVVDESSPEIDSAPLIPREVLFGNPDRAVAKLSPDGKKLAYLAPDEGVLNIWVRTVSEEDDRVVTAERGSRITSYHWSPDSKYLLYPRDTDGDENWHIHVVSAEGGPPRDLTPYGPVQAHILAVEPDHPDVILVGLNDRDPQFHDVYRVELSSGRRTLVQKNDIDALYFVADHDLEVRLAAVSTDDGGTKLLAKDTRLRTWKEVLSWTAEDAWFSSETIAFSEDPSTLYIRSTTGVNTAEVRALDLETGKETVLARDDGVDAGTVLIHPTRRHVQAVAFTRARTEWMVLDEDIREDFAVISSSSPGDFSITSRDMADTTWIVHFEHDDGPGLYYSYDRAQKKSTLLFSDYTALEGLQLAKMQPIHFEARDGLVIHGYLTVPVGVEARSLPAVVFPHGGPWHRDTWGLDPQVQWLANRGYAALQINFRGSTGYGKAFIAAADREWGGKMQDDITDGTRWLIDRGIADPEKICIMGGSYGGYATLMGLAREPELYACGIDAFGIANLFTWLGTFPPYWEPLLPLVHRRVGHPEHDADLLQSRSPVFLADRIRAPVFIFQGANDPRVPADESIQMRDALLAAGREVEYREFADEGHGFGRVENAIEFFALSERFLAEHIGGRFEPIR